MPHAAAASPARIDPRTFLWLLVALAVATMNAPAEIWETIRHLRVPDTDDAMRLAEVRDLLGGQGWYDNVQLRFQPPDGVPSHWSRLVDAPIAGLILALTPLAGRALATGLTAALWPALLFGLYGFVLYRGARGLFGPRAGVLALLAATQTFGVTVQFTPGRVDHHAVQILAILGLGLCMIRGGLRAGLVGGGLAALSLAVGLEGLPYVALGALYLAGDWILRGRPALPAFLGFGLGLGLAAPALFAAQTAPGLWGTTYCDALSPPWLWLAAGGLGTALAAAGPGGRLGSAWGRLALAALCGAGLLGGFALAFPLCLGGPFPGMTPLVRDHWLLTVNEMSSVPTFIARGQWEALVFYPVLAIASLCAAWSAWRGPERRAWSVFALFLWPGLVLGYVQFRGIYVASGLVPLVAGAVIDRALRLAADRAVPARRRWAAAGLSASLVSTVWMAPVVLGVTLAPDVRTAPDPSGALACSGPAGVAALAALPPGTVLAPIFMGPSILLRTPHAVVAAPYHRAIPGLTAAIEGLGGTEADLRRSVAAFGVDYLVACPSRPGDDIRGAPAFATRLARGETSSDWLAPVAVPGVLKVWRVTR
ncbi:hypothetical protein Q8W71_05820 [Methylobacterium sp. NEAU 140]|uniref:hypothetical protein n=1 Tax=Methylobacterium sp. NEAU 140 TaxID=3064945 RepID=UPI00273537FB|nr:hypothetical protein [Methylobacterium sp. NEAU 140]MDP4022130.1 hypothetical protein [Methylobacterium sp. NEAU 140]